MQATYSPEDNKLRLYAESRLDRETYDRVRAAGFIWAPKQELFVAPSWAPSREDLLLELCGEIGDEDTTLVERAEQRAERFEDYSESRKEEADANAERARKLAYQIGGQPILIGHHSEKHARADQKRIDNWSHNAVVNWKTAEYWKERAQGAVRLAKYKGLEADLRKQERSLEHQKKRIAVWSVPMTLEKAQHVAGYTNTTSMEVYLQLSDAKITAEEAAQQTIEQATKYVAHCERWIAHLNNRLEYERAMLAEAGAIETDRNKPEVGGACRCWVSRGGWSIIQKVNKISVTVLDNWGNGGADFTRTVPFDHLKTVMSRAAVQDARIAGRLHGETPRGFVLQEVEERTA